MEAQLRLIVQRVVDLRGLGEKSMAWEGLLLWVLAGELAMETDGAMVRVTNGVAKEGWVKGILKAKELLQV